MNKIAFHGWMSGYLAKASLEDPSNDEKSVAPHADEAVVGHIEGRAKGRNMKEIAEDTGVTVSSLKEQADMGKKVEKEHTKDPMEALRISLDHLAEGPKYYSELAKMEDKMVKAPQGSSSPSPHTGEAPAQVDGTAG